MRVSIAIAAFGHVKPGQRGGLNVYTRSLIDAIADHATRHRYVVLLFSPSDLRYWRSRLWPDHVQFRFLDFNRGQYYRWRLAREIMGRHGGNPYEEFLAWRIERRCRAEGIDWLHYPSGAISPPGVRWACVLTLFDLQHEYYPEFYSAAEVSERRQCFGRSIEAATHIFAPSPFTRRSLTDKCGVPLEKLSILPVGVSTQFRRADSAEQRRVAAKYGLPENYAFYPANPWVHKNHSRLMAALRICRERYGERVKLVLSGRLEESPCTGWELAMAAGVEDQVLDLGFVPEEDMPALYSRAAFLVFPSFFEGFGMPLIEAMACGCPVAAAGATAIPECVGDAALLFDPFVPERIAEAIHRLYSDPGLRDALVRRGAERVTRYSWADVIRQMETTFSRLKRESTR